MDYELNNSIQHSKRIIFSPVINIGIFYLINLFLIILVINIIKTAIWNWSESCWTETSSHHPLLWSEIIDPWPDCCSCCCPLFFFFRRQEIVTFICSPLLPASPDDICKALDLSANAKLYLLLADNWVFCSTWQ